MQQTLSQQQLKCYGRRNRSKPKVGAGGGGNQHVYPGSVEEVGRPAAAQVEEEGTDSASLAKLPEEFKLSGQLSTPESGWGRSRKSTAATEEEVTPKSDVVKKQMPTTRRNSAIKSLAGHGREATGVGPPGKEVSIPPGLFSNIPEKEGSEELVSVSIKCISSNGDLEQRGKKKTVVAGGLGSAGTRKTRAQIARDEAQRVAGGEQPGLENNDVAITSTAIAAAMHIQGTLERCKREDQILTKVDEIWSKREFIEANKDKKVQPKSREPVRSKSHWDFVLEEMAWLAKDFERERKWKVAQAKKVVIRVSRSKLDVEAREIRRQKEEEQRMRRVASGFAKEVKKFWMKVDKLVTYKQQLQIEERKKKALDKHLDFLLGQTERYSTMLAENLTDPLVVYEHQSIQLLPPVPIDDSIAEELLDSLQDLALKELEVSGERNNRDRSINLDLEGVDQDFMVNDEEEQEDDEATLEADEALITESERREELIALQQESELPLEQLLKNYKIGEDSEEEDQELREGETDEEQEDSEEDEEEADKEMNFDDKEGLPKAVKAIIPEQSQHGTVHDETSWDEAEELTRSSWNAKDGAKLMSEMEDSKNLAGSVRSAESGLVPDEQTKAGEKALVMMVQGLKKPQSVQQNDLGMPHTDRTITGHFLETNQYRAGGKLATLVVDLGVNTREDVSSSLSQRRPQRSICCLTTVQVEQGMVRDMQDDEDYFPAAMADGHEEDDDEGTLEEEEQLAKEDDASSANEIDALQRESEMTLEELLAKYKSLANENNEDTGDPPEDLGDILEDRQDRTSEACTSGSNDEEEVDDHDSAQCIAETKARMGQPITSGRDHPPAVSPRSPSRTNNEHVVESLELKQKAMENQWPQKTSDGYRKVDLHEAQQKSANGGGRERNGVLREKMPMGLFGTSLLLQVDGEVDAEAAAALAKVTEAARRRGERMVLRASFASKEDKSSMAEEIATPMVESNQVKVLSATGTSRSMDIEPALSIVALGALPHGSAIGNGDNVGVDATVEGWAEPATLVSPSSDEGKPVLGPSPEAAGLVKDESPLLEDNGSADLEKQELVEEQSSEIQLADAAAAAQSVQPTGYTYSTTKVRTNLPFLLKHSLREYQHIGLDWLVTMYEKRLNGILADEMGLGKTIMTIALLAHLACEKGIWGPHLIVVPTSVMLNWETEFMKWCPAFKILTYFGSAKERKVKRQGWSRPNSFHVCITTYRLVIQDAKAFKRKKWKYLILDEAHLIKNWKSQRWQTLLNFNSKRRILLTGTPLQNDLMELWSLMHFLMPHVFQSHQEFRDWFSNPITGMVEGQEQVNKELVDRLHNVLRPFLLRRLKKDVEKQLPGKFEHVICCQLSKRQRNLYEDFMASSETQETLASGNFLGLINVLMQLRKVCNHPDLFEGRPIISSFDMPGIEVHLSSAACSAVKLDIFEAICKEIFCLNKTEHDMAMWEAEEVTMMKTPGPMIVELGSSGEDTWKQSYTNHKPSKEVRGVIEEIQLILQTNREKERKEQMLAFSFLNDMRCSRHPVYGSDLRKLVEIEHPVHDVHKIKANPSRYLEFSSIVADIVKLPLTRFKRMMDLIAAFVFAIPAARTPQPSAWCSHLTPSDSPLQLELTEKSSKEASMMLVPLRPVIVRRQLFFPDRRLLQFDCGKLQELAVLLRQLKSDGHRALIFTQMTKMLDVLESFINLYGYTYMRLDGSTKPEQRQILMQRFNTNPKIFLFILSTRSGGVGINLVGADTVIFYDSDWNPAMDQQAQDRCHRIGQTREVHIYRLVSESTIEENILKKANQKRILDDLVIQSGSYNTEFFKKLDPMELFSGLKGVKLDGADGKGQGTVLITANVPVPSIGGPEQRELSVAEVEAALKNAEDEADYMAMKRVEQEEAAENQEFTEEVFAGNIDDEDLGDDEEAGKGVSTPGMLESEVMGVPGASRVDQQSEEGDAAPVAEESTLAGTSLIPADVEEDMDMLADVRQMAAAAAAAGREKTSFEDQLRPVERYAMRFLELWDPRVNNLAIEAQVAFEEKEWELDQLEKLKEEQEAEIDEDNEPLLYGNWDTAFADQAYHQQVEVLAQQQENQRQLEWEAMEEDMRDADRSIAEAAASIWGAENFSLKSKGKNAKKAKFKSLAEGSLMTASGIETPLAEEYLPGSSDPLYIDSQSDQLNFPYPSQRKRKAQKILGEEMLVDMHSKKLRKEPFKDTGISMEKVKGKKNLSESDFRRLPGDASESSWPGFVGLEGSVVHGDPVIPGTPGMPFVKNKGGGKISIMGMPIKKGPLVMLEKEKKKDVAKSQEHIPQAAPWAHVEDAVLCAVVHEYGGNWLLASETLAGNPEGGIYRGRYRHPVHCRERFRQLLVQNGAAVTGDPSSEKSTLNAASNAQLKVTEEHTKRLLDVVQQLPDDEQLLPRHFAALLNAVQAQRRAASQQNPEKPILFAHSPRGRPFVTIPNLRRPSVHLNGPFVNRRHAGRPNPAEVLKVLIQSDKTERKVASAHVPPGQLMRSPKDLASNVDESFSVQDFLVGSNDTNSSLSGRTQPATSQFKPPVSIEDLLGISSVSVVPHVPAKAFRHTAEVLVDQRYRVAAIMGLEGSVNEWAAAAASGTGVVGLQVPTKGKNVVKKRPAPDPDKPPKPKKPRIPKADSEKGAPGDSKLGNKPSNQQSVTSVMQKKKLSVQNSAAYSSLSTPLARAAQGAAESLPPPILPSSVGKTAGNVPVDAAAPVGSEDCGPPKDLEGFLHHQAPLPPEGNQNATTVAKTQKSKKPKIHVEASTGGVKLPHKGEKRASATPKKSSSRSQKVIADSAAGSGISTGGGKHADAIVEKGIDLNSINSSDDEVTITGVTPEGAGMRPETLNALRSRLESASSVSQGLEERIGMSRKVKGTETASRKTTKDESDSALWSTMSDTRQSSLKQRATGTNQSLSGVGIDPQNGSPAPHRGGLRGTELRPVGLTKSSFPAPAISGNPSVITKRTDWRPVSAAPRQDPFSSLPSVLPKELSQLQWDPPPPGVWPNPSLPDLQYPLENLRRFADDMAKRSPSTGAGFSVPKGNRKSGVISSFQFQPGKEASEALGSNSLSDVIDSRGTEGGMQKVQGSRSTLGNQSNELSDWETLRNEQQPRGLGDLTSESISQMQAHSLRSAGFSSGRISHGGHLTRYAFPSERTSSPQHLLGTGLNTEHQLLYSSPSHSRTVKKPPDSQPSSSASSPHQQLYNNHQLSSNTLPLFVGSVVVQEASLGPDLGLSLGPDVQQPGVHFPQDEQHRTSSS